ncbi:MAG: FliM/FliN family flagellar motor C-terminal domain-containing protein [Betaproteobacteria bacterium]
MESVLFGQGSDAAPTARAVATETLADLLRSLVDLVEGKHVGAPQAHPAATPPTSDSRRWSGALHFRIETLGGDNAAAWCVHVSEPIATALCGAVQQGSTQGRPPLVQVTAALAARTLSFQVYLDPTTLTLGALQSMRVGDVLPLSHRLDQPLRVVTPHLPADVPPFCAAYLGSRDNRRANPPNGLDGAVWSYGEGSRRPSRKCPGFAPAGTTGIWDAGECRTG